MRKVRTISNQLMQSTSNKFIDKSTKLNCFRRNSFLSLKTLYNIVEATKSNNYNK